MTEQLKHTPTPWEIIKDYKCIHIVSASDKEHVASFTEKSELRDDNPGYIVKCVNEHEDLKAENKRLREALEEKGVVFENGK